MSESGIEQLEARIDALEKRNKRVELDKAWEGSLARKAIIVTVTYTVVVAFLLMIGNDQPFINALVPPIGFFLSTLVVGGVKKHWIRKTIEAKYAETQRLKEQK